MSGAASRPAKAPERNARSKDPPSLDDPAPAAAGGSPAPAGRPQRVAALEPPRRRRRCWPRRSRSASSGSSTRCHAGPGHRAASADRRPPRHHRSCARCSSASAGLLRGPSRAPGGASERAPPPPVRSLQWKRRGSGGLGGTRPAARQPPFCHGRPPAARCRTASRLGQREEGVAPVAASRRLRGPPRSPGRPPGRRGPTRADAWPALVEGGTLVVRASSRARSSNRIRRRAGAPCSVGCTRAWATRDVPAAAARGGRRSRSVPSAPERRAGASISALQQGEGVSTTHRRRLTASAAGSHCASCQRAHPGCFRSTSAEQVRHRNHTGAAVFFHFHFSPTVRNARPSSSTAVSDCLNGGAARSRSTCATCARADRWYWFTGGPGRRMGRCADRPPAAPPAAGRAGRARARAGAGRRPRRRVRRCGSNRRRGSGRAITRVPSWRAALTKSPSSAAAARLLPGGDAHIKEQARGTGSPRNHRSAARRRRWGACLRPKKARPMRDAPALTMRSGPQNNGGRAPAPTTRRTACACGLALPQSNPRPPAANCSSGTASVELDGVEQRQHVLLVVGVPVAAKKTMTSGKSS